MKKVDQTTFGVGEGNCLPACVATITGIPLEEIPNFCCLYEGHEWYEHFTAWLRPLGLVPMCFLVKPSSLDHVKEHYAGIPWIASGPTERGDHCCVYVGDTLYHDPNPCRDGLLKVDDGIFFLSKHLRLRT